MAAREEEPFFSIEDLQTRAKLTKSVVEILRSNGVVKNLNETDQLTFGGFGDDIGTPTAQKKEEPKKAAKKEAPVEEVAEQLSFF